MEKAMHRNAFDNVSALCSQFCNLLAPEQIPTTGRHQNKFTCSLLYLRIDSKKKKKKICCNDAQSVDKCIRTNKETQKKKLTCLVVLGT